MLRKIIRELFLCVLSSGLLVFSFPNYNLWLFAWIGFVPLFLVLENKSRLKAFILSFLTGFIFWLGTIYWLVNVTGIGTVILCLYLALYFGIFGTIISLAYLLPTTCYLLAIPSAWVILEYIRSYLFTGFPWATLGYSQYLNLPVIQIADITGVWGVSFLMMMANFVIYKVLGDRLWVIGKKQKNNTYIPLLLFIILLISSLFYGSYKLNLRPTAQGRRPVRISVIQGNIPQELKWQPQAEESIIEKYQMITKQAAKDNPDLIIWPEAAMPSLLERTAQSIGGLKYFVKELNTPLLVGAVTRDNNFYYNSAIFYSEAGELLDIYDKIHLVPFGEYFPFRNMLSFVEEISSFGDMSGGKNYTIFNLENNPAVRGIKYSVLICFEDVFPELSRRFIKQGADFLINITNDAWFKKTSSPYQHLGASVFRAVENRVWLVRAANTGVSAFIAPTGIIKAKVENSLGRDIFIDGYKTEGVVISKRNLSFYTKYGDVFVIFCILNILLVVFSVKRKTQNAKLKLKI